MTRLITSFLAVIALVGGQVQNGIQNSQMISSRPAPVTNLQLSGLTGRWFEVYESPMLAAFGEQATCKLFDVIPLDQRVTSKSPDSATDNAESFLVKLFYFKAAQKQIQFKIADIKPFDGKLQLLLNNTDLGPMMPNRNMRMDKFSLDTYLSIIAAGELGPNTAVPDQQQYPWIVVTGPMFQNYVILARDPVLFESAYKAQVITQLNSLGYIAQPVAVYQSQTDCMYPALGADIPNNSASQNIGPIAPPNNVAPGAKDQIPAGGAVPQQGVEQPKAGEEQPKAGAVGAKQGGR